MSDIEHEKIRLDNQRVAAELKADFFMIELTLKDIKKTGEETLEHAKKTNGRVTKLEEETEILRFIKKHKVLTAMVLLGFFKIYELVDLKWLFNKLIALL